MYAYYIYITLVWVRVVAHLATSGYHYGAFLDKYVHSIDLGAVIIFLLYTFYQPFRYHTCTLFLSYELYVSKMSNNISPYWKN